MSASKTLKASVVIGGSVAGSFKSAISSTKSGLKSVGDEIVKIEKRQRLLGDGISTFRKMGLSVAHLKREYDAATKAADSLRAAHARMATANSRLEANRAMRQQIGGEFRGAAGTFGAVAASTVFPIKMAAERETAMLGVAKQVEGARDAAGNLTPVYSALRRDIQQLGRQIPIATNELAGMAAAGARMGVAREELTAFVRTSAMMADAFEMPASQLAEDMGKVSGLFQIPIPRIGELADAINHLDDNSKSTGAGIIDVMRRIGGMAQTLKMPAKEAAALGSTFLTLGSSAEVAGTASNAVMRILGAATAQSKPVQAGMQSIGMDPSVIQRSMATDATGTILDVLDKLNSLSNEQRVVASTRIFGAEYGDDIAKLSTGAAEYRRQLALVRGEEQKGSMAREFNARLKTTNAQWQIAKNRMSDLGVAIGSTLLPAVNELLDKAGPMVDKFVAFAERNPGLIKGVVGASLAISGLRVATLGLRLAWVTAKGPVLKTMAVISKWRAGGAMAALGRYGPMAMRAVTVIRTLGTAIAAIGGGPIALLVGAVTVAALVVRKYWEPIKAWVSGAFDGIRESVMPAIDEFKAAIEPLAPAWDVISTAIGDAWDWVMKLLEPVNKTDEELKSISESGKSFGSVIGDVMSFGIKQITAVVDGVVWLGESIGVAAGWIVVNFTSAWEKVKSVVSKSVDWIIDRMQPMINAARTVAGALGFDDGNSGGLDASSGAVIPASMRAPALAAGRPARNGASAPTSAGIPTRAAGKRAPSIPAVAPGRGKSNAAAPSQHIYHITQRPGESQEALARRIAEMHKRNEATAARASMVDTAA
jgi:TP901 family phage tail tape measure protein